MDLDQRHMHRAGLLAWRGFGLVEPNPMVGAVIVRDGVVIGAGHHRRFGGLHAEREALASCARQGFDPAGATIYVTLEPCAHTGKQPPCVDAIIEAGLARVVYCQDDPEPVSAGGAEALRAAGVRVDRLPVDGPASLASLSFRINAAEDRPMVVAKWAQTIDGRVATRSGASKWISNEQSRKRVHRLRARVDAIVTGIGTILGDDSMLTARDVTRRRRALRVVLDPEGQLPASSAIARSAAELPTLQILGRDAAPAGIDMPPDRPAHARSLMSVQLDTTRDRFDLLAALRLLRSRCSVTTIMLECGPTLLGAFAEAGLIDLAIVHIAPLVFADPKARSALEAERPAPSLADGIGFELLRMRRNGGDIEAWYGRLPG